ncbi:hypothetical protein PSU4_26070 [Pseudonocardia sulfidoxydans NBRC 16205]|uniref:Major facilitator superfamily (MFS) profile domain-containing protein n=1 Tax=Pseudonocardia sulfidoxydans NBRC 16205 TaxID=1223511 RepID=A0A511DH01_9PSEU|nr:MFS transporter [Pseudonocardia sulfidoxydans]GEL23653.1 hypothetical protein PSU4_26070 [Pseudonocardia sulfidoxydans NBRC 16205]
MASADPARPHARLHLAGFFGFGPAYVWSEAERDDVYYDFAAWRRLAQTAERGLFSTLFLGDSQRLREHLGRVTDHSVTGRPDQLVLFAHLAAVTSRIGLVATLNTTFTDPVDLARRLATVDVLSGGRAGWNVVTTDNEWTGENFRRGGEVGHADRYRNAEEHLATVEQLWAAWPEGAAASDTGATSWSAPGAISQVVRSARRARPSLPPSPQGQPVLFQAGESPEGRDFAARHAEGIFSRYLQFDAALDFADDLRRRLARAGRPTDDLRIFPATRIILGDTASEARDRAVWFRDRTWSDRRIRATVEAVWGHDLSDHDVDGPLPATDPVSPPRRSPMVWSTAATGRCAPPRPGGRWPPNAASRCGSSCCTWATRSSSSGRPRRWPTSWPATCAPARSTGSTCSPTRSPAASTTSSTAWCPRCRTVASTARSTRARHCGRTSGSARGRPQAPPRVGMTAHPRTVLAICLATGFTTLLDQAILTVAVPALRADLGADRSDVQWILAVYSLAFGLALVPAGRLGDALGRGRLLVGGLAVFSAASLVGAFATAPWLLVLARLVQGIGAGTANPQVIALIQDTFDGPARSRALGAYAAVASLSALLAPLVGGVLLAVAGPGVGWRLVVAVNVPFGIVTCVVAAVWLRDRRRTAGRPHLDAVGIGLLTLVTLCVLLPVAGAALPAVWVAVGIAAVAALAAWERRVERRGAVPILLPALVRSRGFVLGTVVAMCWFGSTLGTSVVVTLALQEGLGLSPLVAGLYTVPSALAMGVASASGWRVVARWGRASVTFSLVVLLVVLVATVAAVLTLPTAALPLVLAGSQFLAGAAGGLITAPNQGLTLALAPPGAHGLAAGFFQVAQRVSATICLAACTGIVVAATAGGGTGSGGYRGGVALALGLAAALTTAAVGASLLDGRRHRTPVGTVPGRS